MIRKTLCLLLCLFMLSCSQDTVNNDNIPNENGNNQPSNSINASDFNITIDENPANNFNIGYLSATSEMPLGFEFISQNPNNSLKINNSSGLIQVFDNTNFDFETNETISGIVKISNATNSINVNITITLNDLAECQTNLLNCTKYDNNNTFTDRAGNKVVLFNNKLWSYGGGSTFYPNGITGYEIWSSLDGINWNLITNTPTFPSPFVAASKFEVYDYVVYQNKVFMVGAKTDDYSVKLWESNDGVNFTQVTHNLGTISYLTSKLQLVVFDAKLFIIGSGDYSNNSSFKYTNNGTNWITLNSGTGIKGRVLVFRNKLWVFGDETNNNAWSSPDGITWVEETANRLKFDKYLGKVIVYNDKLWMWGGAQPYNSYSYSYHSDLWSSCDGKDWYQVDNQPSSLVYRFNGGEAIVFNGKIYNICGITGISNNNSNQAFHKIWTFE
jgi:hypothetical protein